jgi:hypothetical protein
MPPVVHTGTEDDMTPRHEPTNGSAEAAHPAWLAERVRAIDPEDRQRFEGYLREILGLAGHESRRARHG